MSGRRNRKVVAGRPRTQAKRLAEIEERAFRLNVDLCRLRPAWCAEQEGNERDELGEWWNRACRDVGMASTSAAMLLSLLEERAGLDWEALERQREQRRGLWVEEAEDKGPENAKGAST